MNKEAEEPRLLDKLARENMKFRSELEAQKTEHLRVTLAAALHSHVSKISQPCRRRRSTTPRFTHYITVFPLQMPFLGYTTHFQTLRLKMSGQDQGLKPRFIPVFGATDHIPHSDHLDPPIR